MSKVYGYGVVAGKTYKPSDADSIEKRQKMKAYRELRQIPLNDEQIIIEILPSRKHKRTRLLDLIETLGKNDIIIICSVEALGSTPEEITSIYQKLNQKWILLQIYDDKFRKEYPGDSPCNFELLDSAGYYDDLTEELPHSITPRNVRGRFPIEISENFIKVYWLYENYFITEKNTYHNKLIRLAKGTFHKLCKAYETSERYLDDLKEQEETFQISRKPKRYGEVPYKIKKAKRMEAEGMPWYLAFNEMRLAEFPEIVLERYLLKFDNGRKGMKQASIQFLNPHLNAEIALNSETPNNET